MTTVIVHLLEAEKMMEMYMLGTGIAAQGEHAGCLFDQGHYKEAPAFTTHLSGQDAAEEAFDLTNNPGRQDERVAKYGSRHRSVSVGDIVETDIGKFVCCSMGWTQLA